MTRTQEINRVKRMKLSRHCVHYHPKKGCKLKVKCDTKKKNWAFNGATNILNGAEVKTGVMLKGLEPVKTKDTK